MFRRFAAVILSAILLSPGWLGMTGMTLLIGFVPLLWVSASHDDTRRSWWGMFGWATLAFVLWNALTIWWIWYATPVGPGRHARFDDDEHDRLHALPHRFEKAPKALAYVTLVTAWITTEYWYTVGDFSWPWLILGNGFSHEVWAVQWYEYTGVFGGTLWVLLSNILIFEALQARRSTRRWAAAACSVALPMIASLCIWQSWEQPDEGTARVSVIQPNVDCYDKFHGDTQRQERNIADLMAEVPAGAQFILLPETAVPGDYLEPGLSDFYSVGEPGAFWQELTDSLRSRHPEALLITGAGTIRRYPAGAQTETARPERFGDGYYDRFNTAVGLDSAGRMQLHHKGRLVIGVENTPTWVFDAMKFLVIDLGGTVGQIGKGLHGTAFEHNGVKTGPAICYEGLYGDFYGGFVRRGAVHGHHFERRLVGRHARLQTPVLDLAPAGRRTPPRHRPLGQHREIGLHLGPRRRGPDARLGAARRDHRRGPAQLGTHLLHPLRRLPGPHLRIHPAAVGALLRGLPLQTQEPPRQINPLLI